MHSVVWFPEFYLAWGSAWAHQIGEQIGEPRYTETALFNGVQVAMQGGGAVSPQDAFLRERGFQNGDKVRLSAASSAAL